MGGGRIGYRPAGDNLRCTTPSLGGGSSETEQTRVPGGPGWYIDTLTLLPVIENVEGFRGGLADDPALHLLEALWGGKLEKVEPLALNFVRTEPTLRHRALPADVRRDLGRTTWAVQEYEHLLDQCSGTAREAVMWRHLGKTHFVDGDYEAAVQAFSPAHRLRVRDSAAADLIVSSHAALRGAQSLLDGHRRDEKGRRWGSAKSGLRGLLPQSPIGQ